MRKDFFYGPNGCVRFSVIVALLVVSSFAVVDMAREESGPSVRMPAETHAQLFVMPDRHYVDPDITALVLETGVPLEILERLIDSESSWRPHVTSCIRPDGTYDIGLAQINSEYIDYFASEFMDGALDPLHPEDSLRFAARYLSRLYSVTGNWEDAVVAYKIGPSRIAEAPARLRKLAAYIVRGA